MKAIPSFILFLILTLVYLGCGYVVGYYQGYRTGQEDYIIYINKIFEGIKASNVKIKEETKKEEPLKSPREEFQ